MCSRSLEKFARTLKDALQKLRIPSAGDDGTDASTVFDSPLVDTENKTDEPQQVCELCCLDTEEVNNDVYTWHLKSDSHYRMCCSKCVFNKCLKHV